MAQIDAEEDTTLRCYPASTEAGYLFLFFHNFRKRLKASAIQFFTPHSEFNILKALPKNYFLFFGGQ
jgi:hypothetical protein